MCGPAALAWAAVGLTALGGYQQYQAQGAAADAAEAQSKENAKAAEANARHETMTGLVEEDRRRTLMRQQIASQRVALAANNVDMSMGTPLELLGDTAAIGEQDALMIRANAARSAWGYRVQATDYGNQGRIARASGRNAQTGTILSTAGQMASMGYGAMGTGAGAGTANSTTGPYRSGYRYPGSGGYPTRTTSYGLRLPALGG